MNHKSKQAHERARKLRRIQKRHSSFFDRGGQGKQGRYEFSEKAWRERIGVKHEQQASA